MFFVGLINALDFAEYGDKNSLRSHVKWILAEKLRPNILPSSSNTLIDVFRIIYVQL